MASESRNDWAKCPTCCTSSSSSLHDAYKLLTKLFEKQLSDGLFSLFNTEKHIILEDRKYNKPFSNVNTRSEGRLKRSSLDILQSFNDITDSSTNNPSRKRKTTSVGEDHNSSESNDHSCINEDDGMPQPRLKLTRLEDQGYATYGNRCVLNLADSPNIDGSIAIDNLKHLENTMTVTDSILVRGKGSESKPIFRSSPSAEDRNLSEDENSEEEEGEEEDVETVLTSSILNVKMSDVAGLRAIPAHEMSDGVPNSQNDLVMVDIDGAKESNDEALTSNNLSLPDIMIYSDVEESSAVLTPDDVASTERPSSGDADSLVDPEKDHFMSFLTLRPTSSEKSKPTPAKGRVLRNRDATCNAHDVEQKPDVNDRVSSPGCVNREPQNEDVGDPNFTSTIVAVSADHSVEPPLADLIVSGDGNNSAAAHTSNDVGIVNSDDVPAVTESTETVVSAFSRDLPSANLASSAPLRATSLPCTIPSKDCDYIDLNSVTKNRQSIFACPYCDLTFHDVRSVQT